MAPVLAPVQQAQIELITIAAEQIDAMIAFYNGVFAADLRPLDGSPIYAGTLAGLPVQFCPNSIAGVQAEQNRHQLRIRVPDIVSACHVARQYGGSVQNEPQDLGGRRLAALIDPDGNTIEVVSNG